MSVTTSDFLVIGSGISGLLFSLKAAKHGSVNLITKESLTDSATLRAQGGIAAVVSPEDSFEKHIRDTMRVGEGLCHPEVVSKFVKEAPARIEELVEMGVDFCKADNRDAYDLGLEGGHSERRVLHVKDHTGRDVEQVLAARAREESNIHIFENHTSVNLCTSKNRVLGAYVLDGNMGEVETFASKITVLATGGAGRAFLYTSNPDVATGDGIAMAYRAGATVMNCEFVQFHPTLLFHREKRSFLISETLRGEGAKLLGPDGERFMEDYHPDAELAPRDTVSRAIDNELKRTGADHAWVDISFRDASFIKNRFPLIYDNCKEVGIDITEQPIPVVPAAHYMCGGVRADMQGRTDINGLFAIGETAATGFHGANRMASNSLLEGLVLAKRAAETASDTVDRLKLNTDIPAWDPGEATDPDERIIVSHMWDEIRRTMFHYVGVVRSNKRLERAKHRMQLLQDEISQYYWNFIITKDLLELRNIADVADVIVSCARLRKESRGTHYNKDYPNKADEQVDTLLKKGYSQAQ